MTFIDKIRKWPIEKKRIFSVLIALFFTVLIIIVNFSINSLWKDETKQSNILDKNGPINSLQKSLSGILNEAKPVLEKAFGSSTEAITIETEQIATETQKIIDQIISASSSLSTTSNIVE